MARGERAQLNVLVKHEVAERVRADAAAAGLTQGDYLASLVGSDFADTHATLLSVRLERRLHRLLDDADTMPADVLRLAQAIDTQLRNEVQFGTRVPAAPANARCSATLRSLLGVISGLVRHAYRHEDDPQVRDRHVAEQVAAAERDALSAGEDAYNNALARTMRS